MLIQPYRLEGLEFAWCYRVYYRWRTYRARSRQALAKLDNATLDALLQPYDVHVLETSTSETDVKTLASLVPAETVAACAGKTKGRVSKWLREQLHLGEAERLLSRGYFACTAGQSTADAVDRYLELQGDHHGYASRTNPPIFVGRYPITPADEQRLSTHHAVTILQLHIVLSTWRRKGVFGQAEGEATATRWLQMQDELAMALEKVSFVPDHVHLAVRVHPSVSPANMVVALMNTTQELMWSDFPDSVIRAGVERLWQPSAYIGTYGDLASAKIASYVRRWEETNEK
jgi:REP element-mobilizing transposase RayT